jgi:hypothetical protein
MLKSKKVLLHSGDKDLDVETASPCNEQDKTLLIHD